MTSASILNQVLLKVQNHQLSLFNPEGYWWYTLEANEAIGAEYIMLMHFLDCVDLKVQEGLIRRILSLQSQDGSWPLYYSDTGDLSITIECYFVLKLTGHDTNADYMRRARDYILKEGGLTKGRVFTRIHLALFSLTPWSTCPAMPIELVLLPNWMPLNIYDFSSWARACIIPLLVVLNKKPVRPLHDFSLEELYVEAPSRRDFQFTHDRSFLSWENFFIQFDRWIKILGRVPFKPMKGQAIKACEKWIAEHIEKTEDIYPAMAYAAVALKALDHPLTHPILAKCLAGLKRFQQEYEGELPSTPTHRLTLPAGRQDNSPTHQIHQQCCISPVWDTPWTVTALLDSGLPPDDPRLLQSGRWLISKQITEEVGDWKVKNPYGKPGGWSFEFQNVYFPDVDDTVQVLHVLNRLLLPPQEKEPAIGRGLAWVVSMQNDDGGWAAFDKNNKKEIVNKIPFSDHGACLDPSSPDITARVIALLSDFGFTKEEGILRKAVDYLYAARAPFGGWFGRWGINYIYGTWTVLVAMKRTGEDFNHPAVRLAADWLESIQRDDGGWSESPETYNKREYIPYPESVPSQTAWALMGLMAVRDIHAESIQRGINFLLNSMGPCGDWEEKYFTGCGFPGHFYIRYHGYRHYFPLMALAQYKRFLKNEEKK